MAKIQIQQSPLGQRQADDARAYMLRLRVEWVSNQLSDGQWKETPFLFIKLKVFGLNDECHFEDWAGGFYRTDGECRISSAVFSLDTPLPDGHYAIKIFKSHNSKSWIADGTSRFALGAPPSLDVPQRNPAVADGFLPSEPEPLRWAVGAG